MIGKKAEQTKKMKKKKIEHGELQIEKRSYELEVGFEMYRNSPGNNTF